MQTSISAWLKAKNVTVSSEQITAGAALDSQTQDPVTGKPRQHETTTRPSDGPVSLNRSKNASQNDRNTLIETSDVTDGDTKKHLHKQISLEPCTASTIDAFKRLNSLLPIPYNKSFYAEILSDNVTASITRLAIWREPSSQSGSDVADGGAAGIDVRANVIGGIRCRLLQPSTQTTPQDHTSVISQATVSASNGATLYIATLVVAAPYRNTGIAIALLDHVTKTAARKHDISTVTAHVWIANEDARRWYAARGFVETARLDGYYRRLDPSGAIVVERKVVVSDYLT